MAWGKKFHVDAIFRAIDKVTAPVTRMQRRVSKFTRSASRNLDKLNRKMKTFTQGAKRAAMAIAVVAAVATTAFVDMARTGAEFEHTLISAAIKFPEAIRKGTEAYTELEDAARRIGITTEFTATQAAGALKALAKSGSSASVSIAALPDIVDLATVAELELAEASQMAVDTLGAFGLASKDAATFQENLVRVTSALGKTADTSTTDIALFFETISAGGKVVASLGGDIETFGALAGTLAKATIKGPKAGTDLRNIFLGLSAPVGNAEKIMDKLRISTGDADGNMRDLVDVLGQLNRATSDMGDKQRVGILKEIVGKRAVTSLITLMDAGSDELRRYRGEIRETNMSMASMADIIRDSVLGKYRALMSAIEGVKLSIFLMNDGPLADTIVLMTDWVRANEKLIATNIGGFIGGIIENREQILETAKNVGIAIGAFGAFIVVLKVLSLVLTVVTALAALFSMPIAVAVVAVVALVVAIGAAITKFGSLGNAWNAFTGEFAKFGDLNKVMWEGITNDIIDMWLKVAETIAGVFKSFPRSIGDGFAFGDTLALDGQSDGPSSPAPSPQVVTQGQRVARSIEESNTSNSSEVTIRDETGRAEVTRGSLGAGLTLQPSGGF